MSISRLILRAANALVTFIVVIALLIAGTYSVYALWDNKQIYAEAENVKNEMLWLKPEIENIEEGASFEELLAINSDVCAWITMDNTAIDFPVLQGETNHSYINTDVYGNFALAGSIFLDSRNAKDFSDSYSLLYGHHMANSNMFGDLDLYKDEKFFKENTTGILILPDRAYNLETYACLLIAASEDEIFSPLNWQQNIDGLLRYTKENALYIRNEVHEELKGQNDAKILALSTCSSEFTDARTIVLTVMRPYQSKE